MSAANMIIIEIVKGQFVQKFLRKGYATLKAKQQARY